MRRKRRTKREMEEANDKGVCRCFVKHAETKAEADKLWERVTRALQMNDAHGVFLFMLQLQSCPMRER